MNARRGRFHIPSYIVLNDCFHPLSLLRTLVYTTLGGGPFGVNGHFGQKHRQRLKGSADKWRVHGFAFALRIVPWSCPSTSLVIPEDFLSTSLFFLHCVGISYLLLSSLLRTLFPRIYMLLFWCHSTENWRCSTACHCPTNTTTSEISNTSSPFRVLWLVPPEQRQQLTSYLTDDQNEGGEELPEHFLIKVRFDWDDDFCVEEGVDIHFENVPAHFLSEDHFGTPFIWNIDIIPFTLHYSLNSM